jgi:hypothetical protein
MAPQRGNWGGPPYGQRPRLPPVTRDPTVARGKLQLASLLHTDAASIGVHHEAPAIDTSRRSEQPGAGGFGRGMTYGLLLGAVFATALSAQRRRSERSRG